MPKIEKGFRNHQGRGSFERETLTSPAATKGSESVFRLMYGSVSTLEVSDYEEQIANITEVSIGRNAAYGVTGALVFTGDHFAQALEGDESRVRELMSSIGADTRHSLVTVVQEEYSTIRRFQDWNMVYNGMARYVDRIIRAMLAPGPRWQNLQAILLMYELMNEFTKL